MYDSFNRHINYLRISVTDKCNLRCLYCMPAEGIQLLRHEDILSFEEIVEIVEYAVRNGITKIRLTGGEPLVRRGIINLVKMIGEIKGLEDFSMTTNGVFLGKYAINLAKAGLNRVNVSLDTLDPQKYSEITRGGDIKNVLRGLEEAKKAGLTPVKVNMVVGEYTGEEDKFALREYCEAHGFELRFIQKMDLSKGEFSVVEGGMGGDCPKCNRLRVTSNGFLKPCLFNDIAYNIRELGVEKAFKQALDNKPRAGTKSSRCTFYSVGG